MCVCVCMRACVCACVRACPCAQAKAGTDSMVLSLASDLAEHQVSCRRRERGGKHTRLLAMPAASSHTAAHQSSSDQRVSRPCSSWGGGSVFVTCCSAHGCCFLLFAVRCALNYLLLLPLAGCVRALPPPRNKIRVVGINPGWIDTQGERQFTTEAQMREFGWVGGSLQLLLLLLLLRNE